MEKGSARNSARNASSESSEATGKSRRPGPAERSASGQPGPERARGGRASAAGRKDRKTEAKREGAGPTPEELAAQTLARVRSVQKAAKSRRSEPSVPAQAAA